MFFSTIGGDGSQESPSDAGVFVRVFCKSVLFYTMVENFSHKSSIVSLLSVNPFSFPFSTVPLLAATGAARIAQGQIFLP